MKNISQVVGILIVVMIHIGCGDQPAQTKGPGEDSGKAALPADTLAKAERMIVFFGNSLTAGYGLDPSQAFPALIQAKIDSASLGLKSSTPV